MSYKSLNNQRAQSIAIKELTQKNDLDGSVEMRRTFREESNKLFSDHPCLKSFSWRQFTDPDCDYEFYVHRCDRLLNGCQYQELSDNLKFAAKDVSEFLEEFTDGDMHWLFGDCVEICVNINTIMISLFDPNS